MKKLLIAILAIACLAATAVGCSKNDNNPTVTTDTKETIATPVDTDDDHTEAVDTDEVTDDEDETTDEAEVTDEDVVTEEDPTENTSPVVDPVETDEVVTDSETDPVDTEPVDNEEATGEDEFDPNYDYEGEFEELEVVYIDVDSDSVIEFNRDGFPTNFYLEGGAPVNILEDNNLIGLIFVYDDDPNFNLEIIKANKTPDEVANDVPFEFMFKNMNGFVINKNPDMSNWKVYSEGWSISCEVLCGLDINGLIDIFNVSCGELKGDTRYLLGSNK